MERKKVLSILVDNTAGVLSRVCRELALVKVCCSGADRQAVIAVANIFRANVVDVGSESLIIEVTGNQSKLDACISMLGDYEILELARTGICGLSRGAHDVKFL